MTTLARVFATWAGALIAVLWACVFATWIHFRRRGPSRAAGGGLTVIKPVRGLDEGFAENLEALVAADSGRELQILVVMEDAEDPAYVVSTAFAGRHPERDVEIVLSGPCGERMGKTHNMIAGLARAKHPWIVFSDADVRATPELVRATREAFAAGAEAVFAAPYHEAGPGLGSAFFRVGINHYFVLAEALCWKLGLFRFFAGAWMGYTRQALERAGGLEPVARYIADDYAIGSRVVAAGARLAFLREPAWLQETGRSLDQTVAHLSKWSAIIRSSQLLPYALSPLLNPGLMAIAAWALGAGPGVLVACVVSRAATGRVQDAAVGAEAPWTDYALLVFSDAVSLPFWLAGFRRHIRWRGRRYRLLPGGVAKVIG